MFENVLTQVIILFLLMMLGVVLTKVKILTENGVKSMTDLVLYTVTPCVIIRSFVRPFDKALLKDLLISFAIGFAVHICFILLSRLLLHSKNINRQRVLQFGVIFSNCGYMSLPLQQAILGDEGVFYAASFIAVFNVFVWSYGITLVSGDKTHLTPKKILINPGLIAVSIGLVIFLLSVPVPEILSKPISFMAELNTPVPMLIIGYHLTKSNLFKSLKDLNCLFAIAIKLILFPLLALGGLYVCGIRGLLLVSTVISCAAPTAANTTMFAAKFSSDTPLSVNMVSLSTLISLISIPLIVTLAQYIA